MLPVMGSLENHVNLNAVINIHGEVTWSRGQIILKKTENEESIGENLSKTARNKGRKLMRVGVQQKYINKIGKGTGYNINTSRNNFKKSSMKMKENILKNENGRERKNNPVKRRR